MTDSTSTAGMAALKRLAIALVILAAIVGAQWKWNIIPTRASAPSEVPLKVDLPSEASGTLVDASGVAQAALPSTNPGKVAGPAIRLNVWAWNAQMGLFYANGGPTTTAGSLMEKHGVRLQITRQDDTEKSKPEQIKFAQALAKGDANPSDGIQFVIIMGDGAAQYLAAVNKATDKLGPDYRAEIVGAVGYSRGEDSFMGPAEWKDTPESMKGGLVAGVLRDGDWNIAQYFLAQNGVHNNPDEHLYDPTALNWVAADDYLKAVQMYVNGYCEDRKIVRDGKQTSEPKRRVCVQGVVTWTPGDVNVAKQKGGIVRILSTKENAYQMPAVLIGIHKWNVAHAKQVEGLLAATFEGGDQVKHYDAALQRAGKASYAIYAEESPAYWVKYYRGVVERDKTGNPTPLGGSTVMNLGDNLLLFGLAEGSGGNDSSMFKATYEGFGNIVKQQYPSILPDFPKVATAFNPTFLNALGATMVSKADTPNFEAGAIEPSNVVAKRNWTIVFENGKATFTPVTQITLDDLYNQIAVGGLAVEIGGHTDNTGTASSNVLLSMARAQAVKSYLQTKSPSLFPDNRVNVSGYGDTQPIAPNTTPEGRAKNRRVTITLGIK